jgi:threonine dehydrogenase-like Zn-dependent dehydrogenase
MSALEGPARIGTRFIGLVEDIGRDVSTPSRKGDLVVEPFAFFHGTCEFCREGLHTSSVHGSFWANGALSTASSVSSTAN